jgi:hypothetical protein
MSQATQGGATSPQDVQSQNRGGPTAAQQAEGARRPGSENLAELQAALNEARGLDRSGKEFDCTTLRAGATSPTNYLNTIVGLEQPLPPLVLKDASSRAH